MEKLQKFIEQFRVKSSDDKNFNFTCIKNPVPGCFNIPDEELPKFYKLYTKTYLKLKETDPNFLSCNPLNILESPLQNCSSIVIDIDLKLSLGKKRINDFSKHIYTDTEVKNFVKIYIVEMLEVLKFDGSGIGSFDIFVAEKKYVRYNEVKNEINDGFHILIPNIVIDYKIQHIIRNAVIMRLEEVFNDINKFNMTSDEIFDKSVIGRNGWCLYYSCSKPMNNNIYFVTKKFVYNIAKNKISRDKEFNVADIENPVEYFRVFNSCSDSFKNKDKINISRETLKLINASGDGGNSNKKKKSGKDIETCNYDTDLTENEGSGSNENEGDDNSSKKIISANELVSMLSDERASRYDEWIQVGWCLNNISHKKDGYKIWLEFSKRCREKYDESVCMDVWKKATRNKKANKNAQTLTIASLHFWARNDNPEAYELWNKNAIKNKLDRPENTHHDVATIVYDLYKFNYIYVHSINLRTCGWYVYGNHKWTFQQDGRDLKMLLSENVSKMYTEIGRRMNRLKSDQDTDGGSDALMKLYAEKAKIANEISKHLKNRPYKNNIIEEAKELFRDYRFEQMLDQNAMLISFTNGVYDLENSKFRDGNPDDYISMTTGIEYIASNNIDGGIRREIEEFMEQIQPDREVREYMWYVISTVLEKVNREEKFYIFTGGGRNGKSKLVELINNSIGEYGCTLPIALITRKRGESSKATPEIMKLASKRLAILKEPDTGMGDNQLNMGIIKDLTGNDKISARNLHENEQEIKVDATMILMCNVLPDVASTDDGTWDRLRVINFPTHFVTNPKAPNEKLIDKTLSNKIKRWSSVFMTMLIEKYNEYKARGYIIKEPKSVLAETDKYRERNDIFREFATKEFTPDKSSEILFAAIYQMFKAWYGDSYPGRKAIVKKDLEHFLKQHFGNKFDGKKLIGYRKSDEEEDDNAGDVEDDN